MVIAGNLDVIGHRLPGAGVGVGVATGAGTDGGYTYSAIRTSESSGADT